MVDVVRGLIISCVIVALSIAVTLTGVFIGFVVAVLGVLAIILAGGWFLGKLIQQEIKDYRREASCNKGKEEA